MHVSIRKIDLQDLETLQRLGRLTFHEAFAAQNTEEDMKKYLEAAFSTGRLQAELCNPHSAFYFAELQNEAVGYLKVNEGAAQTEGTEPDALEIERIYVLQAFHGKKIGQALLDKAIELAREKGKKYLWLGVWEKNLKAIRFYEKNGFVAFGKHVFKLGDDEQTDILMKLQLEYTQT